MPTLSVNLIYALFLTSAEVDRLFSYYNKIHTDDRRCLKRETIEWFFVFYTLICKF